MLLLQADSFYLNGLTLYTSSRRQHALKMHVNVWFIHRKRYYALERPIADIDAPRSQRSTLPCAFGQGNRASPVLELRPISESKPTIPEPAVIHLELITSGKFTLRHVAASSHTALQ